MQGKFPSVAGHLGFLKAAAVSLSAGLCFRERGNAEKLGAYRWEGQPGSCPGQCPVLLALGTAFREIHFVLPVDAGFMSHI